MTKQIERIFVITKQLYDLLYSKTNKKDREQLIVDIQSLLDQREEEINCLKEDCINSSSELGREIIKLDQLIKEKLNTKMDEIKNDLLSIKKQKESSKKYVSPYVHLPTIEGAYIDYKE